MQNNRIYRMSGCGNKFIIIDNRDNETNFCFNQAIINNYDFDQALILEKSLQHDCFLRIYNKDGSEALACGNGFRCVGFFLNKPFSLIETKTRIIKAEITGEKGEKIVKVDMGEATYEKLSINEYKANIGNDHLIRFLDKQEEITENDKKLTISYNLSFAQILDETTILLKVYERGAGETLACGSGACVTAFVANREKLVKGNKIKVIQSGGNVTVFINEQKIEKEGPVEFIYD